MADEDVNPPCLAPQSSCAKQRKSPKRRTSPSEKINTHAGNPQTQTPARLPRRALPVLPLPWGVGGDSGAGRWGRWDCRPELASNSLEMLLPGKEKGTEEES